MPDSCTIFCGEDRPSRILELATEILKPEASVRHLAGWDPAEFARRLARWDGVRISTGQGSITLSRRVRTAAGDRFSRLILATHDQFRTVQTDALQAQQQLLGHLTLCTSAVGIVSDPEFDDAAGHLDLVYSIARELHGVVFCGDSMFDSAGNLILDLGGNSDSVERPEGPGRAVVIRNLPYPPSDLSAFDPGEHLSGLDMREGDDPITEKERDALAQLIQYIAYLALEAQFSRWAPSVIRRDSPAGRALASYFSHLEGWEEVAGGGGDFLYQTLCGFLLRHYPPHWPGRKPAP